MAIYRVVTSLHNVSGLPEDDVQNVFHFDGPGSPTVTDLETCMGAVAAAFLEIDQFIGNAISRVNVPTVTGYFLNYDAGPPERVLAGNPEAEDTFAVFAAASDATNLPEEVALCLSYKGSYAGLVEDLPAGPVGPEGNIHERARVRGRVYLGPWIAAGTAINGNGHPATDLIDAVAAFGTNLRDNANLAADNLDWAVFSPTIFLATNGDESASLANVVDGWVDNAWDTQRRRGHAPTGRTLW